MNLSSSSVILGEYANPEEYAYEPEYAGITASWLRKAITLLSQIAELNAHRKFECAVKIQKCFRAWVKRKKVQTLHEAATKIQKTWRGFQGRIFFFVALEERVQREIWEYHHHSAVVIQAAFRGFHSRKYSHDHLRLRKLQLEATNNLLSSVATETRKLTKTLQLPGVFSLLNTKCHENVDEVLTVLNMKTYNEQVRNDQAAHESKLREAFKRSIQAKKKIPVPFGSCKLNKQ